MHSFLFGHAPFPVVALLGILAAAQVSGTLRIDVRVLPVRAAPVLHQVSLGGAYLSWQPGQTPPCLLPPLSTLPRRP